MAYIKDINFWHEAKNEGLICDKCGAYITNIYHVTYSDGTSLNYGIECFKKLQDSGRLSVYGTKLLMDAVRRIKRDSEALELWKKITEEEAESKGMLWNWHNEERYKDMTFEEYRQWEIKVRLYRLESDKQRSLSKFKNIDFKI